MPGNVGRKTAFRCSVCAADVLITLAVTARAGWLFWSAIMYAHMPMNKCQAPKTVIADCRKSSVSLEIAPIRDQSPDHAASMPANKAKLTPPVRRCAGVRQFEADVCLGETSSTIQVVYRLHCSHFTLKDLVGDNRLYGCWQQKGKIASPATLAFRITSLGEM